MVGLSVGCWFGLGAKVLLWQTVNGDLAAAAVGAALAGDVVQPAGAVEGGVLPGAEIGQL